MVVLSTKKKVCMYAHRWWKEHRVKWLYLVFSNSYFVSQLIILASWLHSIFRTTIDYVHNSPPDLTVPWTIWLKIINCDDNCRSCNTYLLPLVVLTSSIVQLQPFAYVIYSLWLQPFWFYFSKRCIQNKTLYFLQCFSPSNVSFWQPLYCGELKNHYETLFLSLFIFQCQQFGRL